MQTITEQFTEATEKMNAEKSFSDLKLRKAVLLSQIHGDAIVSVTLDAVHDCEAKIKTMPVPVKIPITDQEIEEFIAVLQEKAQAYDLIVEIVKPNALYKKEEK